MDEQKAGKVVLAEAWDSGLEAAPVTPFTTDSAAWRILAGTCKSVWATQPSKAGEEDAKKEELMVAPAYGTGNTDTKRYWDFTRNIFRFSYGLPNSGEGFHTVDEYVVSLLLPSRITRANGIDRGRFCRDGQVVYRPDPQCG